MLKTKKPKHDNNFSVILSVFIKSGTLLTHFFLLLCFYFRRYSNYYLKF